MTYNKIIDKYLPLLQSLQTNVATCSNGIITMSIRTDNENKCIMASIYSGDEHVSEFFSTYSTEKEMGDIIIKMNAFYASHCTVVAQLTSTVNAN